MYQSEKLVADVTVALFVGIVATLPLNTGRPRSTRPVSVFWTSWSASAAIPNVMSLPDPLWKSG